MSHSIPRRAAALLCAAAPLALPPAARAERARYSFDHDSGQLGFSARHMGMFSSQGRFDRFRADLTIDPDRPAEADVDVRIETGFVTLPWPGATELLRSPPFFDVERFPEARFTGRAEGVADQGAFAVRGLMLLRGVQRPLSLRARLAERRRDTRGGPTGGGRGEPTGAARSEVLRFTAEGEIRRSEFGMTADRTLISDLITIAVEVSILV